MLTTKIICISHFQTETLFNKKKIYITMAHILNTQHLLTASGKKRNDRDDEDGVSTVAKKSSLMACEADPAVALASIRHEFGEHGGVNMSIEASATFTVMEPDTMRRMFAGELGPENDFFVYSRHFNPTVLNLSRQMAALEGTQAAYCTSSGKL